MTKDWQVYPEAPQDFFNSFPEYSKLTLQLLYNRGIKTQKEIDEFFNYDYESAVHDPFLFSQMKKAVERVKKAVEKGEKIAIWADYDADGVCGSAILYLLLKKFINLENLEVYLPDRNKDGYGLHKENLEAFAKWGAKLLITVDCGISNMEEVKLVNNLGIDVIICDHHLEPDSPPPAFAILNPKTKNEIYPFKLLAGVGVVFKFATAILKSFDKIFLEAKGLFDGYEKWFLDLVAIATVADYVSLTGENRALVKYGLYVLSKTNKIGLRILLFKTGLIPQIDEDKLATTLTTQDLSFSLIPRINAMGRLAHASTSFNLLTTDNSEQAEWLAKAIESKNSERQKLSNEAVEQIKNKFTTEDSHIFEVFDKKTAPGILSTVATRLVELYQKPIFVCSRKDDITVCSCRAVSPFNIVEVLAGNKELLEFYGGHPQAAGLTVKNGNLLKLQRKLADFFDMAMKNNSQPPAPLMADLELPFSEVNFEMLDEIKKMEPFGMANWYPRLIIKNIIVSEIKFLGKEEKHLKIFLKNETTDSENLEAVAFNIIPKYKELKIGDIIDIVFEPHLDRYSGFEKLLLKIVDFKINNNS